MRTYFENNSLNYVPLIEVTLLNPLREKSITLKLVADTEFQGGVLLPFKTYLDLNLNLFEEPKIIARTVIGTGVELRVSKIIIKFNDLEFLCHAYTTLGVKRALLVEKYLNK